MAVHRLLQHQQLLRRLVAAAVVRLVAAVRLVAVARLVAAVVSLVVAVHLAAAVAQPPQLLCRPLEH